MDGFVPVVALSALIVKASSFLKFVSTKDWNAMLTQLIVWGIGVGATFLVAATDWATGIQVAGKALSDLSGPSLILVGLSLSSTGSFAFDVKKSLDNSDSSKEPPLTPFSKGE